MIPAGATNELSENFHDKSDVNFTRRTLGKFQRSKILEVYFSRLDGRTPEEIPFELEELYQIELSDIKAFLLGQYPQDNLLQRIFKMMN